MVGGLNSTSVELYSPENGCQHELSPIPSSVVFEPILGFIEGKIFVCVVQKNSNTSCWSYNTQNDTWTLETTSSYSNTDVDQDGEVLM